MKDKFLASTFFISEENTPGNQFERTYSQYTTDEKGNNFCFK